MKWKIPVPGGDCAYPLLRVRKNQCKCRLEESNCSVTEVDDIVTATRQLATGCRRKCVASGGNELIREGIGGISLVDRYRNRCDVQRRRCSGSGLGKRNYGSQIQDYRKDSLPLTGQADSTM